MQLAGAGEFISRRQVFRIAVPLGEEYAGVSLLFYLPEDGNQSCRRNPVSNFILTFRHRASCILGQAFYYFPENAFYIFNQQIYFII